MWGWCLHSVVPRGCGGLAERLQKGRLFSCLHPQAPRASSILPSASGVSVLLWDRRGCWPVCMYPQPAEPDPMPCKNIPRFGLLPLCRTTGFAFASPGENLPGKEGPGWSLSPLHGAVGLFPTLASPGPHCAEGLRAQGCSRGGCRPAWAADVASGIREPPGLIPQGESLPGEGRSGVGLQLRSIIKHERPTLLPCCSLPAWDQCRREALKGMEDGIGDGGPWWLHPSPGTSRAQGDSSPRHGAEWLPSTPLFKELISLMESPRRGLCAAAAGSGQRVPSADLHPLCAGPAAGPVGNYSLISATCCGQRTRPAGTRTMRSCK